MRPLRVPRAVLDLFPQSRLIVAALAALTVTPDRGNHDADDDARSTRSTHPNAHHEPVTHLTHERPVRVPRPSHAQHHRIRIEFVRSRARKLITNDNAQSPNDVLLLDATRRPVVYSIYTHTRTRVRRLSSVVRRRTRARCVLTRASTSHRIASHRIDDDDDDDDDDVCPRRGTSVSTNHDHARRGDCFFAAPNVRSHSVTYRIIIRWSSTKYYTY